jgi:hypothetical protein
VHASESAFASGCADIDEYLQLLDAAL